MGLAAALGASAQTVAVLPLFNLSQDEKFGWIGESVAETIRETLASEGLLVVDRETRDKAYRQLSLGPRNTLSRASVLKLGEALDAELVIHGTFLVEDAPGGEPSPANSSLQLSVRIMNLRELSQSPEETVATPVEDLASAQSRLAWQVLSRIAEPGRAPSLEEFLKSYPPVRLDALESYIRGLMAANSEQKHRLFTQAARLDERFSQPCFQLGRLQYSAKNYRTAAGWFERVPRGSLHYLEAAYYLALCRYQLAEYDKAIGLLEEVAAALPLNEVWNNLGAAQSRRNLPAAVDSFRKAHEGDPNDPAYLFNLGYALWKNGRYDDAAEQFRAALDRNPQDPQAILMLGRSLAKTPPRESDLKVAGLERIKDNFEEMAYRQLRATLERPASR